MMNIFKESNLSKKFAEKQHSNVRNLIQEGQSFSIIGMNSVGVSSFLKFIATQDYAYFVHLDTYELAEFTTQSFIDLLNYKLRANNKKNTSFQDCRESCSILLKSHTNIVIIINKFDLLHAEFSQPFLGNVRTLCHGSNGKISFIFGVTKPFIEYSPEAVSGSNMHIFSRYIYFPPYGESDVYELVKLHYPEYLDRSDLILKIAESGGHMQLLHLILRSEIPNKLLLDPYIILLFKTILSDLSPSMQKRLKMIAVKNTDQKDVFLENMGVIKKANNGYKMFSPLFQTYLATRSQMHLPPKENALFQLLKKNQGRILSKHKIFTEIWKENYQDTSDWALDSMIYRLRKNLVLKEKGYEIKNYKKVGYQLLREK